MAASSFFLAAILLFLIVQYLQALQVDAEPIHPFATANGTDIDAMSSLPSPLT